MRRLRLSLVGTVIVVLLGGLGGAVLAQDDEDAPVWVTLLSQENCRVEADPGTFEPGAGRAKRIRDLPLACDNAYSDARLSGTGHTLYNEDCFESGICVGWEPMRSTAPTVAGAGGGMRSTMRRTTRASTSC